jgi:nucleoid DNA-binding protein
MATKAPAKGAAMTQSDIIAKLMETGLTRNQVKSVFESLQVVIKSGLKSSGSIALFRLFKVKLVHKPAQPARKGINPFTKQEQMFKARPARNVIKVLPLKALKDLAK